MIQGYLSRVWLPKWSNVRRGADLRLYLSDDVNMGRIPPKNKITSYIPDKRMLRNDFKQVEVILPQVSLLTTDNKPFPILPEIQLKRYKNRKLSLRHKNRKATLALREEHRRRYREHKLGGNKFARHYTKFLALVNKTYGNLDDIRDIGVAYSLADGNILDFGSNLLAMELTDRAIGAKSQWLKHNVYSQKWYKSPFGIGTTKKLIDNL